MSLRDVKKLLKSPGTVSEWQRYVLTMDFFSDLDVEAAVSRRSKSIVPMSCKVFIVSMYSIALWTLKINVK